MSDEKTLVLVAEKQVDFYGDVLTAALVRVGEDSVVYVPIRPICDYLGLNWSAQYRRIQRDLVLSKAAMSVAVTATDIVAGSRRPHVGNMFCLPLDYLNGWLFGVNAQWVVRYKVIG
jgi:hypothetical protein